MGLGSRVESCGSRVEGLGFRVRMTWKILSANTEVLCLYGVAYRPYGVLTRVFFLVRKSAPEKTTVVSRHRT